MTDKEIAVQTHELTKIYGKGNTEVIAVRDVNLSVRRGEVVALLGPSGSGKSTLLTAVGLINPPTSGKVMINGTQVLDGPDALLNLTTFRRNHIDFVFQKSNLIPFLSARENVQVALELNGLSGRTARKKTMELLCPLEKLDRFITNEGALHLDAADDPGLSARSARHDGRVELPAAIQHDHGLLSRDIRYRHQQTMTRSIRQDEQIPLAGTEVEEFIHAVRIHREEKIKNPHGKVSVEG